MSDLTTQKTISRPNATQRQFARTLSFLIYLSVAILSFSILWAYFAHPLDNTDGVIEGGWGDVLGVQAMFTVAGNSGIFPNTTHLNWPVGDGLWAHPQLGILIPIIGVFAQKVLGFGVGFSLLLTVSIIGAFNGLASVFFLRSIGRNFNPILVASIAISLAVSPYTFMKYAHINVAGWYFIPILLGFIFRWVSSPRPLTRVSLSVVVLITALATTMWWQVVAIIMVPLSILPFVIRRKWTFILAGLIAFGAVLFGFLFQTFLYLRHSIPDEPPTRYPWDSNIYGGHIVDLLRSSPWLNSTLSRLETLVPGTSPETAPLGMIGLVLGLISILVVLVIPISKHLSSNNHLYLYSLTLVTLLLFISGGLGNFQAGLAVLLGAESPARVWARLSIFLSLLGASWFLIFWESIKPKFTHKFMFSAISLIASLSILGSSFLEISSVKAPTTSPVSLEPEYEATTFLKTTLSPCPIAQLPLDSSAVVRAWDGTEETFRYFYRPFMPYILLPTFYWSIGPYIPSSNSAINQTSEKLNSEDFSSLEKAGYCAILFDKALGQYSQTSGLHLQGTAVTDELTPDFSSERYDVYLLENE